jgi:two-component system alkaline phosphatase synthesis response regulator PhoP
MEILELGKKILIVDDERDLLNLITMHLTMAGYEALQASNGRTALEVIKRDHPSLVILDLMLPELDGWEVCKRLREDRQDIPVIILTACTETEDKLRGFDVGADDYVTKPFSPRELIARVKRVLSRIEIKPSLTKQLAAGNLTIDLEDADIRMNGRPVALTEIEKTILMTLASHPGTLVTHEQLLDEVWGEDRIVEYGNIAVHIRHLRKKIEKNPDHPTIIKTVKGIGYKLEVE